jgi:hypothetical protein
MSDSNDDSASTQTLQSGLADITAQLRGNSTSRWGLYNIAVVITVAIWAFIDGVLLGLGADLTLRWGAILGRLDAEWFRLKRDFVVGVDVCEFLCAVPL